MGLQIDEDLGFQRREWWVERAGWVALAVLVVLAMAGVFSHGSLSWSSRTSGPLRVEYESFDRFGGEATLTVSVAEGGVSGDTARIAISNSYLQALEITSITPRPDAVVSDEEAQIYVFGLSRPGAPLEAAFEVTPSGLGRVSGVVRLVDAPHQVELSQFIYP